MLNPGFKLFLKHFYLNIFNLPYSPAANHHACWTEPFSNSEIKVLHCVFLLSVWQDGGHFTADMLNSCDQQSSLIVIYRFGSEMEKGKGYGSL